MRISCCLALLLCGLTMSAPPALADDYESMADQAKALALGGDLQAAIDLCNRVLAARPGAPAEPKARLAMGYIRIRQQADPADAIEQFARAAADFPASPQAPEALLRIGYGAAWSDECGGCLWFDYDEQEEEWFCATDPTVKLSAGAPSSMRIYYPEKITDPSGRETTMDYDVYEGTASETATITLADGTAYYFERAVDPNYDAGADAYTGALESITYHDGRSVRFEHTDGRFSPSSVEDPDGKTRTFVEYGSGLTGELPTKVSVVDPGAPTNKTETVYIYDSGRLVAATNVQSGLQTRVEYDSGKVRYRWVLNTGESAVYSQTEYTYEAAVELDYDEEEYRVTQIRQFVDPTTAQVAWNQEHTEITGITPASTSSLDRRAKHYYYAEGFLRAVEEFWDGQQHKTQTVYDVDTTPGSSTYGNVLAVRVLDHYDAQQQPVYRVTTYSYYKPDTDYDVSDLGEVPYPDTNGAVPGNGLIRQIVSPAGTTSYSYAVAGGEMKPSVTLTEDIEERISKNVVNADGSVAEVWLEDDLGTLEKVRSYTYYSTADARKGLLESETVCNVASSGENRDMVTAY